jgi:cell division protein FtsQ
MQPLTAPERPISHYRNGKLRRVGPEPEAGAQDVQGPSWRTDLKPAARVKSWAKPRTGRRDPAPSRWAFRMQRLWLTPMFRGLLRIGLPIVLSVAGIAIYLGDEGRRDAIATYAADMRVKFENRPEFMVKVMAIDGASSPVADAIRGLLPVGLPASSFVIDLEALRAAIKNIDAVADAAITIRAGGVLSVDVTERQPAILWRTATSLEMLDAEGHRVATLMDRSARPDLPVIAGEGAEAEVPEALAILTAAQPILPRVRGLVRMGERRWDIVLDRDQRILLPQTDPIEAVQHAMAIDASELLFARDMAALDLRNAARPTLRVTPQAIEDMKEITKNETKVAGQ